MKTNSIQNTELKSDTDPIIDSHESDSLQTDMSVAPPSKPMPSTSQEKVLANKFNHTLDNIYTRPIQIDSFDWTSTDIEIPLTYTRADYEADTTYALRRYVLPDVFFENSLNLTRKLDAFALMKSDFDITVQVDNNPFQQGMLMLTFSPRSQDVTKFRSGTTEYLASSSSFPEITINLAHCNQDTLQISYANIKDYIDLNDPDGSIGIVSLYVVSALEGPTDAESIGVTITGHLRDPEVRVPTNTSILSSYKYYKKEFLTQQRMLQNLERGGFRAQMGEGSVTGPVTNLANAVGAVSDMFPRNVITTSLSWFARAASRVATVFGWSKPVNLSMPEPAYQRPGANMLHTEGKDGSVVLAQIADNAIDSTSMLPENKDEMQLAYILERPNKFIRQKVSKADFINNRKLFGWNVTPIGSESEENGVLYNGTFGFTCSLAKMWRGSINYSVEVIKTQYHATRMVIIYFPNMLVGEQPDTYGELRSEMNTIIYDLQEQADATTPSTFSIQPPWSSAEPWKRVFDDDLGVATTGTQQTCNGSIGIYCMTSLVSAETVTDSITFVVSKQAGKGFELTMPEIQIVPGYGPTQIVANTQLQADLTTVYASSDMYAVDFFVPDFPVNLGSSAPGTEYTYYVKTAQGGNTTYGRMISQPTTADDGIYTNTLLVSGSEDFITPNQSIKFVSSITNGAYDWVRSEPLIYSSAPPSTAIGLIFTETPFSAEMEEGAVHPITSNSEDIAPISSCSDVTKVTTGEYFQSLRPLTKRFTRTRQLQPGTPVSFSPLAFNTSANSLALGYRSEIVESAAGEQVNGYVLPESWLSIVSYLFRFYAGSSRIKVPLTWDSTALVGLDLTQTTLNPTLGKQLNDTEYVQRGIDNALLEIQLPFYGSLRLRAMGETRQGVVPKAYLEVDNGDQKPLPIFEAAGDDFSYGYLIGPPPCVHKSRTNIPLPTLIPSSRK